MRITRLYLRNYRVFEEPLDLQMPAGLVGIYGPNGAGKSYLVEAIRWALYGKARTANDDVRTTGVLGDCITEVELEHESHLYMVRRTIAGANATVRASATADGAQVAEGSRDVATYVQSVLGMDDASFRASVFAEQKQVASFSATTPGKRRDLVLRLLGVTPLDRARDEARRDARTSAEDHARLRAVLSDLDELRQALAASEEEATRLEEDAAVLERNVAAARERRDDAETATAALAEVQRAHDELVQEGRAVARERDDAAKRVARLTAEVGELDEAATRFIVLQADAAGLAASEERSQLLDAARKAEAVLKALPAPATEVDEPDERVVELARTDLDLATVELANVGGRLEAARTNLDRATAALERGGDLTHEAECPTCGQALDDAYERVQEHRRAERDDARARMRFLEEERHRRTAALAEIRTRAEQAVVALRAATAAWHENTQVRGRRADAERSLAEAVQACGGPCRPDEVATLASEVRRRRAAADECRRLEGRLERRAVVEADLAEMRTREASAGGRRTVLLEKVQGLGFDLDALERARAASVVARSAVEASTGRFAEARAALAAAGAAVDGHRRRLEEGEAQHGRIADLADRARHLGRLADLMQSFRTEVVATIGPRLASQAAELFAELTDREYDRLDVDPETYELQVCDAGRTHGLDRFSGSEKDLANLALRVAISEQVRFQSGGAVGLLVLDEVFGPLDDDRRERMLHALERLRGRFRQILVVTHANDVKEQLPGAIEVIKLPGRRATARVVAGM